MKKSLFVIATLLCLMLLALPAMATETTCEHDAVYSFDAENHWAVCSKCGETVDQGIHGTFCTDDGTCSWCDYTGTVDNVLHLNSSFTGDANGHWEECADCGSTSNHGEHVVDCAAPGVCRDCGVACTDAYVEHDVAYDYDTENHWAACNKCGEVMDQGEHGTFCTSDGTCDWCDYTGTVDNVLHGEWSFAGDASSHWEVCSDCGQTQNQNEHIINCDVPGVCRDCGVACTDAYVEHDVAYDYDTENHWAACNKCGEVMDQGEHGTFCTSDGTCDWCDYTGTVDNVLHINGSFTGDANGHWEECADCGQSWNHGEHYAVCANPGVCIDCGQAYSGENFDHAWDQVVYTYDAENHWATCGACGEQVDAGEHGTFCTGDGTCDWCDYTGMIDNVLHINETHHGDQTKHWSSCADCGQTYGEGDHFVVCNDPGLCMVCGMTDCTNDLIHLGTNDAWVTDATYHWMNCADCGEQVYTLEHDWVESDRTESAVTYTCYCGATYTETLKHDHVYIESSRVEATCGVKGKIVCICECGETKTEEIPALEHSYTTTETPATCGVDGKKVTTCALCGDTTTEVIPALEHSYTTTETPATCGVDGKKVTTCALCGDTTTEVIPALEHEYVITSMRQPTCTAKGVKEVACEHCDDEIVTYIDVVAHSYAVTSETAATCEQDGAIVSTCANCGAEQTEAIPATGHAYGVYAPAGDGTHVAECNTCGATRVRDCEYQDVETNGITLTVCSVCGHTRYAELPAEAAEGTVEPDTLFVPTKVAATAVTTAGEELQSGVQLVIYDQTAMLQEGSPILAMYTLGLESDGYAVKPQSALRVELPLTEGQTAETFAQYKLVIIALDGTMTEIEYKIEEGKIIFETELVGILAFLPIEE